ncbi:MAG: ice-binding family protein [Bacteroidia bacterium]
MKNKLLLIITAVTLCFPKVNFGQAPSLGTVSQFVIFSSNGAITHTGAGINSHITGDVGSQIGGNSGFGNVDGVMRAGDGVTATAVADLNTVYLNLSAQGPATPHVPLLGGETLSPGIYSITLPATPSLVGVLTLDGGGNPNAYFLFQLGSDFSTGPASEVKLINGAKACNVFWLVEGVVNIATGTKMRGNIIVHNAAINIATGVLLEGRALSTTGAISVNTGLVAFTPIGCGSPTLTGPIPPNLASAACYAIFSADGPVTDDFASFVTGDVGTNLGSTLGYDPLKVTGTIHSSPDGSTNACATDIGPAYNYLNLLPSDIELLYPANFGYSLVLTPHTYVMNSAVTFTDTLFLNAEGDPAAVFVLQVNGAFSTSTYSTVVLQNGAQAKNVFWKISGAATINDFSVFKGTIVSTGAITLKTGVQIEGRVLTSVGAINTFSTHVLVPVGTCVIAAPPIITTQPVNQIVCAGDSISFSVTATGTGLTYQWRKGTVNLINGGNISGATSATLTINPATVLDAALNYNVIVSGSTPPNDTSINVSLTVNPATIITSQPNNKIACVGDSITFSVTATGGALTYQWRKGTVNLINGGNISGATSATLTINPATVLDAALNYNVIVSGACGNDTSINVSLTVNPLPIAIAGSNSPVCSGDSIMLTASTVVGATYSWTGSNGYLSSLQNPVINPVALSDAGTYSLTVTDGGCTSTPSTTIVVVNNCNVDLSVVKTVSTTTPFIGHTVVFTIVVTNNSLGNATGVVVNEALQSGYAYVSSTTTSGSYSSSTGLWTIGTIPGGTSDTLTITAKVIAGGNYVNTVFVSGNQADGNLSNNTSTVETFPTDFNIPEGFSPNGDGINDLFVIRGIEYYPKNKFEIYNRWGDKVFEASPYQNNWDGRCAIGLRVGGDVLPVGTYFYILDLGDGSTIFKGTIYLNK